MIVDGRRIESLRIAARRAGLPAVVMLHEGLGSVSHWRDFPQRVAGVTDAEVFVYSRHGHGQSAPLTSPRGVSYLHHEAGVVLPSVLEQAGIREPVLFGHSDGASIALIHASRHPVAGLILEAPHVFVEDVTVEGVAQFRDTYLSTAGLGGRLARHHADPDTLFAAWSGVWLSPEFRDWNIESCLDSIRCPVLVIQGEDDEYATLRQVDAIRARIPAAEALILPACKHTPHRDQPAAVLARVGAYFAALMQ